jgi:hypothetical protein
MFANESAQDNSWLCRTFTSSDTDARFSITGADICARGLAGEARGILTVAVSSEMSRVVRALLCSLVCGRALRRCTAGASQAGANARATFSHRGAWHLLCDVADAAARGVFMPPGLLRDGLFINRDSPMAVDMAAMVFSDARLAARRRLLTSRAASRC